MENEQTPEQRDQAEFERLLETVHPGQAQLLGYFEFRHLPPHLQAVSEPFCALATGMLTRLGATAHGAELTTALRKLLEAKDCAVRAALGLPEAG